MFSHFFLLDLETATNKSAANEGSTVSYKVNCSQQEILLAL